MNALDVCSLFQRPKADADHCSLISNMGCMNRALYCSSQSVHVQDNDDFRRGKPTNHKVGSQWMRSHGEASMLASAQMEQAHLECNESLRHYSFSLFGTFFSYIAYLTLSRYAIKVYGEDVAILAGDALLCRAFELVASTENVPPQAIVQVTYASLFESHLSKNHMCAVQISSIYQAIKLAVDMLC